MMNTAKILAMNNGYDVEISFSYETIDDINAFTQELKKHGEFLPRPRFSKNDTPFTDFVGTVKKTEPTKTKNGKDMFIAHILPDGKTEDDKDAIVSVMYLPPEKTWRIGDRCKVTKGPKGWLELHEEVTEEPPF